MARIRKDELSPKTYERIGRAAIKFLQQRRAGKTPDREALLRAVPADAREQASGVLEMGNLLMDAFGPSDAQRRQKR